MVFPDTYLQPHAPDPVLREDAVVAAARRHAPDAGRLLEVDESGGEARAYLLEGDIVVKTQRPHRLRPRTSLAKEAMFLGELARRGGIPVPQALGHGEIEGIEYLCLTRIDGAALRHVPLEPAARAAALHELGRTLRAIHEIDQSALADSQLMPGDRSPHDLRTRLSDTFDRLGAALDADERFRGTIDVPRIAAARLAATPADTEPVALHSNPGPEHTFVNSGTATFTGLIDFGDAYRSHPALDLRPWTDPADADALLAGYSSAGPLPEGFDQVRHTGFIIMELSRAARGRRTPDEVLATLEPLLLR